MSQFSSKPSADKGFILPLIIIVGLIIGAGLMALSARTFSSLIGSIRQGQSREAREAAETGLANILKELNRNYPYLLIESCIISSRSGNPDCAGWKEKAQGGSFVYRTSICPKADAPPQNILSKLAGTLPSNRGRYRLISYNFSGDQHQGGVGRIKVLGEKTIQEGTNTIVRSTAYIDQELSILPKNCSVPVNSPATASGFPGLLGTTITLRNNDVLGSVNGNVLCTSCNPNGDLANEMKIFTNGIVNGRLFGGQIAMPEVPQFPALPAGTTQPVAIEIPSSLYGKASDDPLYNPSSKRIVIQAGASNNGACYTDTNQITHCKIKAINLTGQEALEVISSGGKGVRLYVEGGITIKGNGAYLKHDGSPADLGIFGKPLSTGSTCETITLAGGATTTNAFLYFPSGCVGIDGGASLPDFRGAIWAYDYGTSNGSASNNAEIDVPENMGSLLFTRYGTSFGIGVREFAALGVNKWMAVQLP